MENSDNCISPLTAGLLFVAASMICNTKSCHRRSLNLTFCSVSRINDAFTFHLCHHETPDAQQITASSVHQVLAFVNAALKDAIAGRFRVPVPGANATRDMTRAKSSYK